MVKSFAFLCVLAALAGCSTSTPNSPTISGNVKGINNEALQLTPSDFSQIASWKYNNFESSLTAFQKSCTQVAKNKRKTILSDHPLFGYAKDWQNVCSKARQTSQQNAKQFFETELQPVLVSNQNDEGMFTGYYIPELRGSFVRDEIYRYPLYARPSGKKLPSRASIVRGALNNSAKPLIWVDSEVDSFFLHIQGSGNVRLPDNRIVHVAYAGQNGHKYYAIGRYLIEKDYITKQKMSAQAIKDWLNSNPDQAQTVMNLNPSYIFFQLKDDKKTQQAKGAAGVDLTPEYSLAVDDEFYPYGLPMWIETGVTVPINGGLQDMAFERLMIAQDTGGAINGAVRGDIFFGSGQNAEIMAGKQKSNGRKYVLLPRNVVASRR
ncbi:MAG: membrane-bound lytic murein transglycosylase A [Alphaproteobacteria bacterium]|jgi:membrane-bound lytic murein transglycosylase A